MVPDLDALARWPWTGHVVLLGLRPAPFLDAREVLRHFGDDDEEARRNYARWMAGPDRSEPEEGAGPAGSLPAAGSAPDLEDPVRLDPRDDQAARRRAGWNLDRFIRAVCGRLGVGEHALRAGRRTRPVRRARAEVPVLAVHGLGLAEAEVARNTGFTPPQAISRAVERLAAAREEILRAYPELDAPVGEVRSSSTRQVAQVENVPYVSPRCPTDRQVTPAPDCSIASAKSRLGDVAFSISHRRAGCVASSAG